MRFSRPIAEERWALVMPDHERDTFTRLDRLRQRSGLRVAVLRVPEWVSRVRGLLPRAEVVSVGSITEFVTAPPGRFDAMYTGYERGTVYSLLYPQFSAVVPDEGLGSVPLAFTTPPDESRLLEFVDAWVEDARASGLLDQKLEYWVHGSGARAELGPRWSVGRNVLGWWR